VLAAAEQAEAGTIQWRVGAPTYRSPTGAAWRCGPSAHRRRGQQAPAISTAAINTFLELKGIVSDPGQSACGRNSSDSLASQHPQRSESMPARSPVHRSRQRPGRTPVTAPAGAAEKLPVQKLITECHQPGDGRTDV